MYNQLLIKKFFIYCDGKKIDHQSFETKEQAQKHIQTIRERVMKYANGHPDKAIREKYRSHFDELERYEVLSNET